MDHQLIPILHTADARETAKWYLRLGFEVESEHRFAPGLPLYLFLKKGDEAIHLSEHSGDAKPDTLLYYYVADIETYAAEFGVEIIEQPWCREIHLRDPDNNRIRIGERRASNT